MFAIETHHLHVLLLLIELFIVVYIILGLAILIFQVGIIVSWHELWCLVCIIVAYGRERDKRGRYVIYLVYFMSVLM